MLIDSRQFPEHHVVKTDICIIGSGPAGLTLARELSATSRSIALLESGGLTAEPAVQDLNLYHIFNEGPIGLPTDRNRQTGGNSNLWCIMTGRKADGHWDMGVRYMPLDEMDFHSRDWIPHSGWPIGQADLLPYYKKSEKIFQCGSFEYGGKISASDDKRPISWSDNSLTSKTFGFGSRHVFCQDLVQELTHNQSVSIYLYATAVELETDRNSRRIQRVRVSNLTGKTYWVEAEIFVLAMGGIETTRLLLASRGPEQSTSIGNEQDLVGRFLMDHPIALEAGILHPASSKVFGAAEFYDLRQVNGYPVMGHLALTREAMEQHHLLNTSIMLFPQPSSRQIRAVNAMKSLFESGRYKITRPEDWSGIAKHGLTAMAGLDYIALGVYLNKRYDQAIIPHLSRGGWTSQPRFYNRFKRFDLILMMEQDPDPSRRISLSPDRDALGMPGVDIHWSWGDRCMDTASRTLELLSGAVRKSGLGRVELPWRNGELQFKGHGACHPMGTTRMSWDPGQGVVNPDCRVHSVPNLYVASSSVFPTGGYANPTFTVLALSLRLADHIKGLLATQPVQGSRSLISEATNS
jgi:choline dehydrogenase-like flavoprotein